PDMRQEDRRPDGCLRAAESGELGVGEEGNNREGHREPGQESGKLPERTRDPTLGHCRATVGPQVREARHVFSYACALRHASPYGEIGSRSPSLNRFRLSRDTKSAQIPLRRQVTVAATGIAARAAGLL